MLEMLLDKKLLFVLMGMLTGLGVADKCIVSMTMKRMMKMMNCMMTTTLRTYEQKQSSVDAPGPGEIRACMYDQ